MFNRIFKHKFISVDVNINIQKTNEIRKLMKKKFRLSINHSVYLEEFKQGNKTHIDDLFFLIQNKKIILATHILHRKMITINFVAIILIEFGFWFMRIKNFTDQFI